MDCKPKYLLNEILPLMNSKMPKGQPIVDLFKVNPYYYTKWMPPRPQDLKFCNCLIKCFGILIVVANLHVFCPQMRPPNKSIGVDFDSLNQMEKASSFLIGQWLGWISKWVNTIHTRFQFTWALSTMNRLYFGIWIPFAFMTFTKGPPHKYLILHIFWL